MWTTGAEGRNTMCPERGVYNDCFQGCWFLCTSGLLLGGKAGSISQRASKSAKANAGVVLEASLHAGAGTGDGTWAGHLLAISGLAEG